MESDRVIKALHVLETGGAGLLSRLEAHPIGTLLGQGGKERFQSRVVRTVPRSTPAHFAASFAQRRLRAVTGPFTAAVGMVHESGRRATSGYGQEPRQLNQVLIFYRSRRPANHQAREQIQDHRQVQPTCCRFHGFGRGDPLLVGQARRDLPVEMLGSKAPTWCTPGGGFAPLRRLG